MYHISIYCYHFICWKSFKEKRFYRVAHTRFQNIFSIMLKGQKDKYQCQKYFYHEWSCIIIIHSLWWKAHCGYNDIEPLTYHQQYDCTTHMLWPAGAAQFRPNLESPVANGCRPHAGEQQPILHQYTANHCKPLHHPTYKQHKPYAYFLVSAVVAWALAAKIAPRLMPHNLINEKPTLNQVMFWWQQASSHYLSQCRPSSILLILCRHMASLGYNDLAFMSSS